MVSRCRRQEDDVAHFLDLPDAGVYGIRCHLNGESAELQRVEARWVQQLAHYGERPSHADSL